MLMKTLPSDKCSRQYDLIERALKYYFDHSSLQPSLKEVADHLNLSEHHFHRMFSSWAGVSPKKFLQTLTLEHAKTLIDSGASATDTSYTLGLSSTSRLFETFVSIEAITPAEFKSKGLDLVFFYGIEESPFGKVFLCWNKRGLHQLQFITTSDPLHFLVELKQQWPLATFKEEKNQPKLLLDQIFGIQECNKQKDNSKNIKLWVKATNFQQKVWMALLSIPEGSVLSYQQLALAINKGKASRAVGSALAKNSIAYLIPCHRVIRANGDLGQYRWGGLRKKIILGKELAQY